MIEDMVSINCSWSVLRWICDIEDTLGMKVHEEGELARNRESVWWKIIRAAFYRNLLQDVDDDDSKLRIIWWTLYTLSFKYLHWCFPHLSEFA